MLSISSYTFSYFCVFFEETSILVLCQIFIWVVWSNVDTQGKEDNVAHHPERQESIGPDPETAALTETLTMVKM